MADLRKGLGRIKDKESDQDWLARAVAPAVFTAPRRPARIHLGERLGPLLDQDDTPECVAHAAAVIKTFHERRQHRRTWVFEPHRLYAECKKRDGIPNEDGTFIRTVCEVLAAQGAGRRDRDWDADAARFRIAAYLRLLTVDDVCRAVHSVGPVEAGVDWFDSWFSPVNHLLATPANPGAAAGGHAVTICGYSDTPFTTRYRGRTVEIPGEVLIIRNSWGFWADAGYGYLPYEELRRQLAMPSWRAADCWQLIDQTTAHRLGLVRPDGTPFAAAA